MSRRVKEIVDIGDHESLDELIQKLGEVRDGLPRRIRSRAEAARRRRVRAPHHHHLLPRPDRPKKPSVEKRYAEAVKEAKERELERLQAELGVVCYAAPGKRGKLSIVVS